MRAIILVQDDFEDVCGAEGCNNLERRISLALPCSLKDVAVE